MVHKILIYLIGIGLQLTNLKSFRIIDETTTLNVGEHRNYIYIVFCIQFIDSNIYNYNKYL